MSFRSPTVIIIALCFLLSPVVSADQLRELVLYGERRDGGAEHPEIKWRPTLTLRLLPGEDQTLAELSIHSNHPGDKQLPPSRTIVHVRDLYQELLQARHIAKSVTKDIGGWGRRPSIASRSESTPLETWVGRNSVTVQISSGFGINFDSFEQFDEVKKMLPPIYLSPGSNWDQGY